MKTTAEQHVRIVRHLMDFAGLGPRQAEFVAVEAWAAVASIVEDALSADRDNLRSLLAASESVRRACDERLTTQRVAIERMQAERDQLREALRAIVTQTAPVMIALLGFAKCPVCQFSEGRCAPLCPARIAREALSRHEATQPAPAVASENCPTCVLVRSYPGERIACALHPAQPAPVRDAGVKEEP